MNPAPVGTAYFYTTVHVKYCDVHPYLYWVWNQERPFGFCGMCWIQEMFRAEVPSRLNDPRSLAENGNPAMDARFLSHLEAQLGLVPPLPDQPLLEFRLARRQYMRQPSTALPVSRALWTMMGFQPKLAKPLVRYLCGQTEEDYAIANNLSLYTTRVTLARSIRLVLKEVRKK